MPSAPLSPPPRRFGLGPTSAAFLLMGLGFFGYSVSDALAKLLTEDFHVVQIAWTRQLGLLAVAFMFFLRSGPAILRSRRLGLQISRGLVAGVSPLAIITAFSFVPIADAVAVTFIAPFIVTILSALILHESVGPRRWSAIAIGFVGMLVVIRPGAGVFHPAMFLVVLAASAFATRQILSRELARSDATATTVAYTALGSLAMFTLPLPFFWQTPREAVHVGLFIALAVSAGVGELLVIRALEMASAVVLAPLHYTMILWATMFGWLVFDQLPDSWTLFGATVIVASGIYTIHRERQVARARGA